MRSMLWVTLIVAIVALVGAPAMAQDVRSAAMGETGVGLADGPDALGYNPAGLPFTTQYGAGMWRSAASGLFSLDIDTDDRGVDVEQSGGGDPSRYGVFYSGRQADMSWGLGAQFSHISFDHTDSDLFGVGAGVALGDQRQFSVGAGLFFETVDSPVNVVQLGDDDFTSFDIGGMWRTTDGQGNAWRVGLVATDVTEEYGSMFWRLGASVATTENLILALDLYDVTDEFDSHVNFGAEYLLMLDGTVVPLRAGLLDGDLTLGAAYRMDTWELGLSFQDLDNWQELSLGATGWF